MKRELAALLLIAAASTSAQASQVVLVLRARVSDGAGRVCAGLPIAATSTATSAAMATTTDGEGRSLLPLALGSRSDLARAPVVIRLRSGDPKTHLEARNGAPEIALSFGIPADDTTQLQIITSGGEVGARIADAFRQARHDTVEAAVELRCGKGAGSSSARVELDFSGRVPLPKLGGPVRAAVAAAPQGTGTPPASSPRVVSPPATEPRAGSPSTTEPRAGSPPATGPRAGSPPTTGPRAGTVPAPGGAPGSPAPGSAPASSPRDRAPTPNAPPVQTPSQPPAPTPTPPARPAPVDTARSRPAVPCDCRLVGTVEVESDRPIEERLRVIVRVREVPALADTVELYMGSPRPFRITGLPCGNRHLDVTPLSKRRFRVLAPEQDRAMNCTDGLLIQPRVILAPR